MWTGIEYAVAGAMIYEGLIAEARQVVRMARSRYDGRLRDGLNSGPGGNPFNELECGKFYARAMSSWSLLIASPGAGARRPAGASWGSGPSGSRRTTAPSIPRRRAGGCSSSSGKAGEQTERIEVRHGQLRVRELVFALPGGDKANASSHHRRAGAGGHRAPGRPGGAAGAGRAGDCDQGAALDVVLTW